MKNLHCLLLLSIVGLNGMAAQISLRGKIANVPPNAVQKAILEYWNTERWQQLETITLNSDGSFSVSVDAPVQAQARFRMVNQPRYWADFLLPALAQEERELVFDMDFNLMDGGPARVVGSPENDLYHTLMSAQHGLTKLRDSERKATLAQIEAAERDLNRLCRDIATQHKGTFSGDIVAPLLIQPQKQDYPNNPKVANMTANEFAVAYSLYEVPFRYERALYHTGFVKALNRYYHYFDRKSPEGGKQYIDGVMSRRNGNDEVDNYVFRYLLDKMMDYKDEAGLTYLLTWYLPDCPDENPLPNSTLNLLEALKNCEPGKLVPDLRLPDLSGQIVSLGEVCAKNKMTLLLFWRSNCSHCKEFEPRLMEIYGKYRPLGVEVFALSSDKMEQDWRTHLEKEPTPWLNVFIPMHQRREISRQFPSPSTPTLISIDRERKVLSRLIVRSQLEAYLEEVLPSL